MRHVCTASVLFAAWLGLAACGSSDDDSTPTPAPTPDTSALSGSAAAEPGTGDAAPTAAADTVAPAAATTLATEPRDLTCPDGSDLAAAYGGEVALDTSAAMSGALGLLFCPYNQVLAPGATHPTWGYEAIPDSFSITFTDQNILAGADGEPVEVSGAEALWFGDELSVWTGERGIIVSMLSPPGDPLATAIAIAEVAVQ